MTESRARVVDWVGYAVRWKALHGGYDPRTAKLPVRAWLRMSYRMARGLARLRVSPAQVTLLGLLVCVLVPVIAALGGLWPVLAGVLVVLAGLLDTLDGALAVVTRRVTRFGYVYDAVVDRLGEAAWLVAFWLAGVPGWVVALTACMAFLHEYLRARATAAGLAGLGALTVGERPVRVMISAFGLVFAGLCAQVSATLAAGAGTLAVAIWLLFGVVGFLQLFGAVERGLR
ncbi:MAG: CDP-alcohol phosphatidyltransferase family protein [Actinocatenispora sp.]